MGTRLKKWTPDPDGTVYAAAAICYGKDFLDGEPDPEKMKKLLYILRKSGHMSPYEHANFTFEIFGISRIAAQQLTRHRIASYSQQSQRYVTFEEPEFVVPESVRTSDYGEKFSVFCVSAFKLYEEMTRAGIPAEDARYLIPGGVETKLTCTMNARELDHFFSLRLCERAQWEIRAMAGEMLRLVMREAPLLFAASGPPCVRGECTESVPCGRSKQRLT